MDQIETNPEAHSSAWGKIFCVLFSLEFECNMRFYPDEDVMDLSRLFNQMDIMRQPLANWYSDIIDSL